MAGLKFNMLHSIICSHPSVQEYFDQRWVASAGELGIVVKGVKWNPELMMFDVSVEVEVEEEEKP